MKKTFTLLWLAAAVIFSIQSCKKTESSNEKEEHAKNQEAMGMYYWSLKQKIFLSEDTSSFIILLQDSSQLLRHLENINDTSDFQPLKSGYYLVRNQSLSSYSRTIGVGNIQPVFKSMHGEQLIPTGDILILPLPGVDIEEVLKITKTNLKIIGESASGRYIVNIQSRASVLDVANAIYESGKVSYCHPDFIANIKLMSFSSIHTPDKD